MNILAGDNVLIAAAAALAATTMIDRKYRPKILRDNKTFAAVAAGAALAATAFFDAKFPVAPVAPVAPGN
jgi:hypothetical protein